MSRKGEYSDTGKEDGQHEGDSAAAVGLVELVRMLREEQAEQQRFMLDAMKRMMECSRRDDEHSYSETGMETQLTRLGWPD